MLDMPYVTGMSYEEKGTWVYLAVSVGAYAWYLAVILGKAAQTPFTELSYVPTLLWAIGIAIIASIVGRMVFAMSRSRDNYKVDARDKEINRFGEYVSGIVLGAGMVGPFVLALAEFHSFWIANAMYLAFVLAAIVGAVVKLVSYRRGL